jgi:predicted helicase
MNSVSPNFELLPWESIFVDVARPSVNSFFNPGIVPQCFPFYIFEADGNNRRENITDWALDQFTTHYNNPVISKWSIFDYLYGILHHPDHRAIFADNLKVELPRIPFAADFRAIQRAGQQLIQLHQEYLTQEPWKLKRIETSDATFSNHFQKMKLSDDRAVVTINESLSLGEIPAEAFDYRLGNRSVLEWVIDQSRGGEINMMAHLPDAEGHPESIARFVGQVVRLSVETMRIVNAMPLHKAAMST